MSETNLTCDQVRQLVEATGKQWAVVILAGSDAWQFVTWGRSAEDKVHASDLAAEIGEDYCGDAPPVILESFHAKEQAARNKERLEKLEAALREIRDLGACQADQAIGMAAAALE